MRFGYYLDRYGLELVGSVIGSFDSSAELSGRDIRTLVARIRATGVKAIFSETSLPPRAAETIGRDAGVKVVVGETPCTATPSARPGPTVTPTSRWSATTPPRSWATSVA